jgi:hypothetical protein
VIAWWVGALLGALGGSVADGTKIATTMMTSKRWPWARPKERLPFLYAILIRIGCAAAVPSVVAVERIVGWSDQPLALFALGLAAPSVVQHAARIGRVCLKALLHEYTQ